MKTMVDIYADATPLIWSLNNELGEIDSNNISVEEYLKEHFDSYNNMIQELSPKAREFISFSNANNLEEILDEIKLIQQEIIKSTGKDKEDYLKAFRLKKAYFTYVKYGISEIFSSMFNDQIYVIRNREFDTNLVVIIIKTQVKFTIDVGKYPVIPYSSLKFNDIQKLKKIIKREIIKAQKIDKLEKLLNEIQKGVDFADRVEVEKFYFNKALHRSLIEKNPRWKKASHYIRSRFMIFEDFEVKYYVFGIMSPDSLIKFLQENNRIPNKKDMVKLLPLKAYCGESILAN